LQVIGAFGEAHGRQAHPCIGRPDRPAKDHQPTVTDEIAYLAEGRHVFVQFQSRLAAAISQHESVCKPVVLPGIPNEMLYPAAMRWPAFAEPEGRAQEHLDEVGITEQDEGTGDIEPMDLGESLESEPVPLEEEAADPFRVWAQAMDEEGRGWEEDTGRIHQLFRAIVLQVESAPEMKAEGREYGKGRDWVGLGLVPETRERLLKAGHPSLRRINGFGREAVFDGYWCMGVYHLLYRRTRSLVC
jgi:hypothetical protein